MKKNLHSIKEDFPIFLTPENKQLVYLDNSSTTHKPICLLKAINDYYIHSNSNIGRGLYHLAMKSEEEYEQSRKNIAQFINCHKNNITFTAGTTQSLNQVAYLLSSFVKPKQKIILSILEHHANILPWQRLAKQHDLELIFIKDNEMLEYPEKFDDDFWKDVIIISLTHVSNVNGQIINIEKWCSIARKYHIISIIDGAQGICSTIVDIKKIDCDFYAFSAHKIYGPMGLGVLYIADKFIETEPMILGGGIIEEVSEQNYKLLDSIQRFEAGTPNVASIVSFNASLDFLLQHDWPLLLNKMHFLGQYLYNKLEKIPMIDILPSTSKSSHIITFNIKSIHSHDVGTFLANYNIAVRVGKHCTYPLHEYLNINSSIRVSLGIYNCIEDIDYLINILNECILFFKEV